MFEKVLPANNSIAVYTILSILRQMKENLGLEAMIEYMEKYMEGIEANNPEIKSAVQYALSLMSIEKMYKQKIKD